MDLSKVNLRRLPAGPVPTGNTVLSLINAFELAIKTDPDTGIGEFLATRTKYMSRKYDLTICAEMGYDSFDKEGAKSLFNTISTKAGGKATIKTLIFFHAIGKKHKGQGPLFCPSRSALQ